MSGYIVNMHRDSGKKKSRQTTALRSWHYFFFFFFSSEKWKKTKCCVAQFRELLLLLVLRKARTNNKTRISNVTKECLRHCLRIQWIRQMVQCHSSVVAVVQNPFRECNVTKRLNEIRNRWRWTKRTTNMKWICFCFFSLNLILAGAVPCIAAARAQTNNNHKYSTISSYQRSTTLILNLIFICFRFKRRHISTIKFNIMGSQTEKIHLKSIILRYRLQR